MKFKKFITSLLAILIIFSSVSVFAAPFKDVPNSHWATSFIEDMKQLGYLKGYTDGSFRPSANIRFTELMKVLSEFNKKHTGNSQSMEDIKKEVYFKYDNSNINRIMNGTPEWAREYVLHALNVGIVTINELSSLLVNDAITKTVNREDTMVYFAKAMGLERKANEKVVASLPYKDQGQVTPSKIKLLSVLLDNGVLSPEGKGNGMFKPRDLINRAEMAKMLSIAENAMGGTVNPSPQNVVKGNSRGRITAVPTSTNLGQNLLTIERSKGSNSYLLSANSQIKVDGRESSLASLAVGQEADIVYNILGNEIISITAVMKEEAFNGNVTNISKDYSTISVQDGSNKKELRFDSNSLININGKTDLAKNIVLNDTVKGIARDGVVIKIDVEQLKRYEGIVTELGRRGEDIKVRYKLSSNSSYTEQWFPTDSSVEIIVDEKKGDYRDFRIGRPVTLAVQGDKLVRLEIQRFRELSGFVKRIDPIDQNIRLERDIKRRLDLDTGSSVVPLTLDYYSKFERARSYFSEEEVIDSILKLDEGDNIEVRVDYDIITDIKATRRVSTSLVLVKGTARLANGETITVAPVDRPNDEKTYKLIDNPKIEIGGNPNAKINDLIIGSEVTIEVQNDVIKKIVATTSSQSKVIWGKVIDVDNKNSEKGKHIEFIIEYSGGRRARIKAGRDVIYYGGKSTTPGLNGLEHDLYYNDLKNAIELQVTGRPGRYTDIEASLITRIN